MLSNVQCDNCGAYLDFGRLLPKEILDDIEYLVGCVQEDDARPHNDADLEEVRQRLAAIGIYPASEIHKEVF